MLAGLSNTRQPCLSWFGQRLRKQPPDDLSGRWQPSTSIDADASIGAL